MGNANFCGEKEGQKTNEIKIGAKTEASLLIEPEKQNTHNDEVVGKARAIQSAWKQKKERAEQKTKIRIFEENLNQYGSYISLMDVEQRIPAHTRALQLQLPMVNAAGIELDSKRVMRKPILFKSDTVIYYGQWNTSGFKEGYGYMVKPDGTVLEGMWRDDALIRGRKFNPDGSYYEGDLWNEQEEGLGNYSGNDGTKYSGEWGWKHL